MWCPSCTKSIKGGVKDSLVQHLMSEMECLEMTRATPPPSFEDIDIAQLNEMYEWEVANAGGNMGGTDMGGNNNQGGSAGHGGSSASDQMQQQINAMEEQISAMQRQIDMQADTVADMERKRGTMDREITQSKDTIRRGTPYKR